MFLGVKQQRVQSVLSVLYETMDSEKWSVDVSSWSITAEDNGCMRLIITMYTGCQFPYYKLENLGSRFGEDVEINLAVVDNQHHQTGAAVHQERTQLKMNLMSSDE